MPEDLCPSMCVANSQNKTKKTRIFIITQNDDGDDRGVAIFVIEKQWKDFMLFLHPISKHNQQHQHASQSASQNQPKMPKIYGALYAFLFISFFVLILIFFA